MKTYIVGYRILAKLQDEDYLAPVSRKEVLSYLRERGIDPSEAQNQEGYLVLNNKAYLDLRVSR
jgi:hypothetical protein